MSYVQVPPDSTGKKVHTQQNTIGLDTVQTQVMHLADKTNASNLANIDHTGALNIRFTEGQPVLSGFGYLKTAQQRVLGVYESSAGSYDDLFSINTTGTASSTYDDVAHGMLLTVDGASGSKVTRTTNRYHYYMPASANLIMMTIACGDTGKVGNHRRWGAFDDSDGLFFELTQTSLCVVLRSSTTGSIVNTKVVQANWNGDKLDGTGASGFDLDVTKINLWWIDYQWLGAGRVRFGVYEPDGTRTTCHTFENAGSNTLPYMRTGTLPLRTENENIASTGSSSELRESCMAIYTEGTHEDYTFWRNADVNATAVSAGATDTHLVSVRSTVSFSGLNHHNSVQVYPETLNIYTDQPVAISLFEGTTVTGGTFVPSSSSTLEISNTGTVTDNVSPFKTWYFGAGAHTVSLKEYFEVNDEGIQLNSDDTQSNWSFMAKRLGSTNATVTLNMGYKELY